MYMVLFPVDQQMDCSNEFLGRMKLTGCRWSSTYNHFVVSDHQSPAVVDYLTSIDRMFYLYPISGSDGSTIVGQMATCRSVHMAILEAEESWASNPHR